MVEAWQRLARQAAHGGAYLVGRWRATNGGELPRRSGAASSRGARNVGSWASRGRASGAHSAVDSHAGFPGTPRVGGQRAAEDVRDVPRSRHVSRVSPPRSGSAIRDRAKAPGPAAVRGDTIRWSAGRRHASRRREAIWLPSRIVPHAPPELGLCPRGELQRLPQPCAVLSELPPTVGPRGDVADRPARLPRRVSRLQPWARPGRATESRVVRVMPRGARLHGVSFGGERRVPLQPPRAWLRCGPDAVEEPVAVQGMSRQRDTEGPVNRGVRRKR